MISRFWPDWDPISEETFKQYKENIQLHNPTLLFYDPYEYMPSRNKSQASFDYGDELDFEMSDSCPEEPDGITFRNEPSPASGMILKTQVLLISP